LRNDTILHLERCGPLARRVIVAVLTLFTFLALAPVHASAASLDGASNTYVQGRKLPDSTKVYPLYEYLDFNVQNMGGESLSAHFGGWYRYDLKEQTTNKDVQYGYVSYKGKTANSMANMGRVMVFEGVAADRVDGAYVRTDLLGNFGISAFGGVPVEIETEQPGNNVIYGARLSHQVPGLYRIGISALKEQKNSEDFRKEEGVDLWLRPVGKVEILGRSNYNAITKEWMDNTYILALGPFANLRLNTTASWINYKDYFTGATTSVFSFQPGVIDPNEKVKILGEEVAYGITDNLNISADYKAYDYEIAGNAKYYGGNIRYSKAASGGAGLSAHLMSGGTDTLNYTEYRVYGFKKIGKADITLDALDVAYKTAINGVKDAYSVTLAAAYEVKERLKVGADVEYSKNPDFDKDVRGFLKIVYSFDTAGHSASASAPSIPKAAAEQGSPVPRAIENTTKPAAEQVSAAQATEQASPKPVEAQVSAQQGQEQSSPKPVAEQVNTTVGTELGIRKEGTQ
jgi:hypothetical protein